MEARVQSASGAPAPIRQASGASANSSVASAKISSASAGVIAAQAISAPPVSVISAFISNAAAGGGGAARFVEVDQPDCSSAAIRAAMRARAASSAARPWTERSPGESAIPPCSRSDAISKAASPALSHPSGGSAASLRVRSVMARRGARSDSFSERRAVPTGAAPVIVTSPTPRRNLSSGAG